MQRLDVFDGDKLGSKKRNLTERITSRSGNALHIDISFAALFNAFSYDEETK